MEVKEELIKRLTIIYDNTFEDRDMVFDYLNKNFGKYNYKIVRSGPKSLGLGNVDRKVGKIIAEVEGGSI